MYGVHKKLKGIISSLAEEYAVASDTTHNFLKCYFLKNNLSMYCKMYSKEKNQFFLEECKKD